MCQFFSFLSDGKGNIYYFTAAQRAARITDPYGGAYRYDSHSSIACYFIRNGGEDSYNLWEFNPFKNSLQLDTQNTFNDWEMFLDELVNVDFDGMIGDLSGAVAFVKSLKNRDFLNNPHGVLPERVVALGAGQESPECEDNCMPILERVFGLHENRYGLKGIDAMLVDYVGQELQTSDLESNIRNAVADYVWGTYLCKDVPLDEDLRKRLLVPFNVLSAGYNIVGWNDGILYCRYRG